MTTTIYHNPRCSKSRQTLALLEEQDIEPRIVEYLKTPPDIATLKKLIQQLGMKPIDLVRMQEAEFKLAGLDKSENLTDDRIIEAMVKYPKLIERPIVVHGDRAALGRPPENVMKILK